MGNLKRAKVEKLKHFTDVQFIFETNPCSNKTDIFYHQAQRAEEETGISTAEPREMITPMLRSALEKQGYKLIGTHSGVKLCRWTKVNSL